MAPPLSNRDLRPNLTSPPPPKKAPLISPFWGMMLFFGALWVIFAFLFLNSYAESSNGAQVLNFIFYALPLALIFMFFYIYDKFSRLLYLVKHLKVAVDGMRNQLASSNPVMDKGTQQHLDEKLAEFVRHLEQTQALLAHPKATDERYEGEKNDDGATPTPTPPMPAATARAGKAQKDSRAQAPKLQRGASLGQNREDHKTQEAPPPSPVAAEGAPTEENHITIAQFIRVADFSKADDGQNEFSALYATEKDSKTVKIIRAAQDVLTLLAQNGIYAEDITYETPNAATCRRLAKGERATFISELSVVFGEESLERVEAELQSNPVFKDTAYHFLRIFEQTFVEFEEVADDSEILGFLHTRTYKAFVLLGQACGKFNA